MKFRATLLPILCLFAAPAGAQSLAGDMSCAQAIAFYEKNRVIHVMANGRTVVPLRLGTPIRQAGSLQCSARGAVPHGSGVKTRDAGRCIVAMRC